MEPIDEGTIYFSYSQFFVYDAGLVGAGCDWTEEHVRQGFARRDGSIAVGTLLEFGDATVRLYRGHPEALAGYERAISTSLIVESDHIAIDGPEESPGTIRLAVAPSVYRIVVAQRVTSDDSIDVAIFVAQDSRGVVPSEVLIQDEELDPPTPLIETAEVPNV